MRIKLIFSFFLVGLISIVGFNMISFQNRDSANLKINTQYKIDDRFQDENSFRNRVTKVALDEWKFFGYQTMQSGQIIKEGNKETDEGYWQRIGTYWQHGTEFKLTGKNTDWPWSAAFISWVLKTVGAGNKFKYSIRHSDYIVQSIQDREIRNINSAFWGYRLNEHSPKIGDLVCYARQENVDYTTKRNYKSHCDIVVNVEKNSIDVIGGNIIDSVTKKSIKIDSKGKLVDNSEIWFVTLKNILDYAENL